MNEQILRMLLTGEVRVLFNKRENNLLREMLCTLNKDDIPPEQYGVLSSVLSSGNPDLIVAWDMEKNDWRSFYATSIVSIRMSEQKKEIEGQ